MLKLLKNKNPLYVFGLTAIFIACVSLFFRVGEMVQQEEQIVVEEQELKEASFDGSIAEKFHLTGAEEEDEKKFQAWLVNHQNPSTCDRSKIRTWHHGAGMGSELQIWKNTFLKAITSGNILASGFDSPYVNLAFCPQKNLEECVFQPISSCKKAEANPAYEKSYSSCAIFDPTKFSRRVGLKRNHSMLWFHAQAMKYLLRPREVVLKTYEMIKSNLGFTDMSKVLSVHVRHGDVGWDGRKRIPTSKYARVLATKAFWEGYEHIFVGSDDTSAFGEISEAIAAAPAPANRVKVVEMPADVFQLTSHKGMISGVMKHRAKIGVATETDYEIPESLAGMQNDTSGNSTFVPHKDEGIALVVEMMIMAYSGAAVGTLNSNFGRVVYELMYAQPPKKRGSYYDLEKRPYFGCGWRKKLPYGGGNTMFPYN